MPEPTLVMKKLICGFLPAPCACTPNAPAAITTAAIPHITCFTVVLLFGQRLTGRTDIVAALSGPGRLAPSPTFDGARFVYLPRLQLPVPAPDYDPQMTPDEFRRFGHAVVDFIADYREHVAERPGHGPGSTGSGQSAAFRRRRRTRPSPGPRILQDLREVDRPRPLALAASAVLRLLPVQRLARERARRLRQHRPRRARPGVAVEPGADRARRGRRPTGCARWSACRTRGAASSRTRPRPARCVALLCARERTTGYGLARGGLQAEDAAARRLRLGAQPQLGREGGAARRLRPRATSAHVAHDDALRDARRRARRRRSRDDRRARPRALRGRRDDRHHHDHRARSGRARSPTSRARHGLWLHVDAAMAGSAMILPECRWMWEGVEGADSLVVNPHKWLGAAFDCSVYYVRDPEHLVRVMSTNPSYLQIGRGRPREELSRLGHSARPPLPRAEAVVPDPRAGRRRPAGAAAARPRQRAVARRARCAATPRLARARAGAAADGLRAARAGRP